MTELEIMQRAKEYIDKMANGINPVDDTTIPENDTLNNIRLSRCLFYVSDILAVARLSEPALNRLNSVFSLLSGSKYGSIPSPFRLEKFQI